MTNDRVSSLDASFLRLEDANPHMHVAAALIFAGKPPPYERLLAHVESRLGLVPRLQRGAGLRPSGRWLPEIPLSRRALT